MKVLMVNKFLYPNGGSETYMFKLGEFLQASGHQVEYFGMEHEGRTVGNSPSLNIYVSDPPFGYKNLLTINTFIYYSPRDL